MSHIDMLYNKLIESQVEKIMHDDSHYQAFATPLKSVKLIKQEHRRQLIEFFKLKGLQSQLDLAQKIILTLLPNFISLNEFTKVKDEFDKSVEHFFHFIESTSNKISEKPVLLQEIFGLSNETLLHVYDLAAVLVEKGEIQDSCVLLTFLTTLAPHVPSYWIGLGVCYQNLNHHEDAVAAFKAAKLLKPLDPRPSSYTIESYLLLKENDKAKFEFEVLKETIKHLDREEQEIWKQKTKNFVNLLNLTN